MKKNKKVFKIVSLLMIVVIISGTVISLIVAIQIYRERQESIEEFYGYETSLVQYN